MQRPRLSERVIARRQVRDGQLLVALHDPSGRTIHVVGAREWMVLACADGTRDLEGIAAAAARLGVEASEATIAAFFATLGELGWLVDGPPTDLLAGRASSLHRTPSDRPVVAMPGVRVRCEGEGGCCRAYASIVFMPEDVHAAAFAVPAIEIGESATTFLPVHGSAPTVVRAVGLVDGACAYLDADGRCSIHARVGFASKPLGCRWYPARVRDDGTELRVAPAIECLCVARPHPDGDALVPEGVRSAGDLPVGLSVETVPERVVIAGERRIDRAQACAFADEIASAAAPVDAIARLWTLASALERGEVDPGEREPMPAAVLADACARWARAASERRAAESVWRSAADPVCVRLQTLAQAAALLSSPTAAAAVLATTPDDAELEAYVVRAGTWGRLWLGEVPLVDVLRDHAVALALARAIAAIVPADADGTLRGAPLAAVLALRRTCLGGEVSR
ncbi:MAG TPA: hypothetical protein VFG69_10580 [Nannocystaceae bacterium]|nr:hypothetical protein [Nannocystaceae bacterium]